MRLKKLEIVGFKSFLEKTSFDFTSDITGIVGPNGCGKSNVVDAIKWVTGELSFKELRGRSMQDLIFSGSELRPPTSMAEVALTLDNSDGSGPVMYKEFSDLTVIRRVFRDGTSEFFINKTPCRLRDVIDIFLDTGIGQSSYSIIEQGRVGQIVASKAEDRRIIIEEAAGITKFKHRKKAAERKMEYTRQNLLRVSDVLGELKRQIGSLERQAKKAEKYKEVSEEARKLDLAISARNYEDVRKELSVLETNETEHADQVESMHTELTSKDSLLEQKRLELMEVEKVVQQAQQKLMEATGLISQIENKIETSKVESERLREMSQRERNRGELLAQDTLRMQKEIEILVQTIASLQEERKTLLSSLESALSEESKIHVSLRLAEQHAEKDKEELLGAVAKEAELKNQITTSQQRLDDLERRLLDRTNEEEYSQAEAMKLEEEYKNRQRELGIAVQLKFGFEREHEDTKKRLEDLEAQRSQSEKDVALSEQRLEGLRSRLKALEEFQRTYQGYGQGVRAVMEKKKELNSSVGHVLGLLGELVRPKRGFERAVETVLENRVKFLVVKEPREAISAIEFLKTNQQGRASFISSQTRRLHTAQELPTQAGVLGWLRDFVEISNEVRDSVTALIGNVVVVDTLSNAVVLWEQGSSLTFVTPEGESVSRDGVVTGGSWGEEKGVLQIQSEILELKETCVQLEVQRETISRNLDRTIREIASITTDLDRLARALTQESQKAVAHEKDFGRLEEALQRIRQNLSLISDEKRKLNDQKQLFIQESEAAVLSLQSISIQRESIELKLRENQDGVLNLRTELNSHSTIITDLKVKQASMDERVESLGREKLNLENQIQNANKERTRSLEEATLHEQQAVQSDEWRVQLSQEREEALESYKLSQEHCATLRTDYDVKAQQITDESAQVKVLREELNQVQEQLIAVRLKTQEERMRLDYMVTQVFERYAIQLPEYVVAETYVAIQEDVLESARTELIEYKEKLSKIGDVNLAAIDELKELTERFAFMTQQKDDLETSLDSLTQAIKKINSTTKELFEETFNSVNQKFEEIFPKLFRGGKAKLFLTDPENLLESGVEIVAQPPGKRLQNMNLLSGGEKALTAISLIFAIFLHKAPPFCLLDEVDAPLDDHNVKRYLGLVQEMSTQTQFIVITHNKLSMETAKNLYGVTMEEPGVSRTVSVKIHQAAQMAERNQPSQSMVASVA